MMKRLLDDLLCYFGFHRLGPPELHPHEYEELQQEVVLVRCLNCGVVFRRS